MENRDNFLDSAKFVTVWLVIYAHLIWPRELELAPTPDFILLYAFMAQTLAFLSGYLAKSIRSFEDVKRRCLRYFPPYFIAQIMYALINAAWEGKAFSLYNFLIFPYGHFWFLMSLICWCMMLLPFIRIRHGLILAVFVALLAGYVAKIHIGLSLSRTLVFFPFFLLGYHCQKEHLKMLTHPKVRIASAVFLMVVFLLATTPQMQMHWEILLCDRSYSALGYSLLEGLVGRILMLFLSALAMLSFLSLIPWQISLFGRLGGKSLYPYVLHAVPFGLLGPLRAYFEGNVLMLHSSLLIVALGIYLLLGNKFTEPALRYLLYPHKSLRR